MKDSIELRLEECKKIDENYVFDVSLKNYYDRKLLSASMIKKLILIEIPSYKEFKKLIEEKIEGKALDYGTKVHEYLLEDIKDEAGIWKEVDQFKTYIDSIKGEREKEIFKDLFGIPCKSKIDIYGSEVYDIKTTSESNLEDCIEKYKYNYQMAFYELMTGKKTNLIIINKNKRKSLYFKPLNNLWKEKMIIEETIYKYYKFIERWINE